MAKAKAKTQADENVIEYNKEVLSLLNDLCSINESIIIKRNEDKLVIQRMNNARSVAYEMIIEPSAFNYKGDVLAFYKFPEFYQLLSCFDTPSISHSNEKLIISKDKSKINYLLSDAETLMKGPSKIKFADPEASFEVSSVQLKELKKMIGLLVAKNVKISCSDGEVDMTLYNNSHDNSFKKTYEATSTEEFEYPIASDIFTLIPDGDYTIEIMKAGAVCFTLKHKDISLRIITTQIDED